MTIVNGMIRLPRQWLAITRGLLIRILMGTCFVVQSIIFWDRQNRHSFFFLLWRLKLANCISVKIDERKPDCWSTPAWRTVADKTKKRLIEPTVFKDRGFRSPWISKRNFYVRLSLESTGSIHDFALLGENSKSSRRQLYRFVFYNGIESSQCSFATCRK